MKRAFIWLEELLEDPDILKPPEAIAPRLAWANRVTLLAAREKGGKSTIAGAAAAAVSAGRPFLGDEVVPGNVLIIALEEHPAEFAQRLVGFGADPKRVAIVQGGAGNLVKRIREAAEEVRPALIVWDTLGAFADAITSTKLEPNDSQGWTRVMMEILSVARDFGSSLLLHHSNKSDGRYRDSTAIGANVDVIIEMFGERDDPRVLKTQARFPTEDLRVVLQGGEFRLLESQKEFEERVVAYVARNPKCSFRDLADGVSGRTQDVADARDRLLKVGKIMNVGSRHAHEYMATR